MNPINTFRAKILVIVPAYNEEKSVKLVVSSLNEVAQINDLDLDVIIVNDGSTDHTSQEINSETVEHKNVIGIDLPYNMGIGNAVHTGYLYAQNYNYDIALQFDGDGQHPAEAIPLLIKPIIENRADFTIGSRFLDMDSPGFKSTRIRKMGISFFSSFLSLLLGIKITDPTSGFRAVNLRGIGVFSSHYPYDYPEPEAIAIASQAGLKIEEISVQMKAREYGFSSINRLKSIYYMFKVTLAILIQSLRRK